MRPSGRIIHIFNPDLGGPCMPKLIIHSPAGTFNPDDRTQIASALTQVGLECESLPHLPLVMSTVWTHN